MLRFVLNIRDNFPTRRNILETNQSARRTIEPFENNNKRSQGRLGEGGPLRKLVSTKIKRKSLLSGHDSMSDLVPARNFPGSAEFE